MSSNPRVRRLKARVARLKARVEAIKPRVKRKNSEFEILNSMSLKNLTFFTLC